MWGCRPKPPLTLPAGHHRQRSPWGETTPATSSTIQTCSSDREQPRHFHPPGGCNSKPNSPNTATPKHLSCSPHTAQAPALQTSLQGWQLSHWHGRLSGSATTCTMYLVGWAHSQAEVTAHTVPPNLLAMGFGAITKVSSVCRR